MPVGALTSDLIRLCGQQVQYARTGFPTYLKYDVGFCCRNIVSDTGLSVQDTALNYIQEQIPITTPYPDNSIALARSYQIMPMQSDNAVEVVVSYIYDELPISATQWVIETTNYPEVAESDVAYNSPTDPTLVPVTVGNYLLEWTDPSQAEPVVGFQQPSRGILSVLKPRKQWTYTKTIYGTTDAQTLDDAGSDYICTVNSTPWTSQSGRQYPVGTILCYNVSVTYQPYQASNLGVITFLYHPEGWQPWCRYQNSNFPLPNLWRPSTIGGVGGMGYAANGYIQVNGYLEKNHNILLTLI